MHKLTVTLMSIAPLLLWVFCFWLLSFSLFILFHFSSFIILLLLLILSGWTKMSSGRLTFKLSSTTFMTWTRQMVLTSAGTALAARCSCLTFWSHSFNFTLCYFSSNLKGFEHDINVQVESERMLKFASAFRSLLPPSSAIAIDLFFRVAFFRW